MAWLVNEGTAYLESGELPARRGNAHPSIVPYQLFAVADGHVLVAVGNDGQFRRFAAFLGADWPADPRFATNPARLDNRDVLIPLIEAALGARTRDDVMAGLEAAGVPVGPVNDLGQALGSDQARARDMVAEVASADAARGHVRLLGNPLRMSATPVAYRRAPPRCGAHTAEVPETRGTWRRRWP